MFKLAELAERLGVDFIGDSQVEITGVAPTHLAMEGDLSFLLDASHIKLLEKSRCSALIIPRGLEDQLPGQNLLVADDVKEAFDRATLLFRPARTGMIQGISPSATIAPSARLAANVAIGAGVVVGAEVELGEGVVLYPNTVILDGTVIGAGTVIFPNVTVYENCVIGKNCILHAGAVIGAYGFGYDSSAQGHRLSPQLGNVVIEDGVDIGAGTTIDRGTHGSTRIGKGSKIDNLVMIAHNCSIGAYNLICAHTGMAGSSTTGDFVVMAGRVGVKDHTHIGTGAVIGAMAGIMGDIPEKAQYVGIPATDFKEQFKKQAALAKLPQMRREFAALQRQVEQLSEILKKQTE